MVRRCIILVIVALLANEAWQLFPYVETMVFLNGKTYERNGVGVSSWYFAKELAGIFQNCVCFYSLSVLTVKSRKLSLFFWIICAYHVCNLPLYVYNHCASPYPFEIMIGAIIIWACWMFWPKKVIKMHP